MNKTEFIDKVAEKANISKKDAASAVSAGIDIITEELKAGNDVILTGFGTFSVAERAARMGRNPQTNEPMEIPASIGPKFKAGKTFKEGIRA